MTDIEKAAKELHEYFKANCGSTDEWPMDIITRDDEASDTVCKLLNNLQEALVRKEAALK